MGRINILGQRERQEATETTTFSKEGGQVIIYLADTRNPNPQLSKESTKSNLIYITGPPHYWCSKRNDGNKDLWE